MVLTDKDLALTLHRYRARAGGPILPGVTTVIGGISDKGGMVYKAAEIAAQVLLEKPQKRAKWVKETREELCATKGKTQWAQDRRELGMNGTDTDVLVRWARNAHKRLWDAKAARGQRIHDIAERFSRGEPALVLPGDEGFVTALERYHELMRPRSVLSEVAVANVDYGYGGRFDDISDFSTIGRRIVDYKTGNKRPFENALQAAAYIGAAIIHYGKDGMVSHLSALPPIDGALTVYLNEDGSFDLSDPFANVDIQESFALFCAALRVFNLKKPFEKKLGEGDE